MIRWIAFHPYTGFIYGAIPAPSREDALIEAIHRWGHVVDVCPAPESPPVPCEV